MKLLTNLYTRLFFKHYATLRTQFIQDYMDMSKLMFEVHDDSLYVSVRVGYKGRVLKLIVPCAYLKTLEAEYEKTTAAR